MKCPHCLVEFFSEKTLVPLVQDIDGQWAAEVYKCPNEKCMKASIYLINAELYNDRSQFSHKWEILVHPNGKEAINSRELVRPKGINRPPIPSEVPHEIAKDYKEACLVLIDSKKASAALSRRCLQNVLRSAGNVKHGDLYREIQQVIDNNTLPSYLAQSIDAIRQIGNFAAHPLKSTSTGEIVDVEEGEAEWLLDVLEALFDFYFVQPAILQAKKNALNVKLQDMGKSPMK